MRTIKISIPPAMRDFNEAVETADALTDFRFDRETACGLLKRLNEEGIYPYNARALAESIAAIAIKR